jgi:hypothetical protein
MLGPLEVAGAEVHGARLRALLIRLALDSGRVVTMGRCCYQPEHGLGALWMSRW